MTNPLPCLPAEWHRQAGILLTWPHAHGDWAPFLDKAEPVFVAMARAIAAREPLIVSCYDAAHLDHVRDRLEADGAPMAEIALRVAPSNDVWVRDHGPITVLRGDTPTLLDFGFNGWGRKYPHQLDNRVTRELHASGAFGDTPLETVDLILEGGSIESDGLGTLMTTTSCLLSPERNPELDCSDLASIFGARFGSRRVLWLKEGHLAGDDTDGHIDTLARFCDPETIAYVACDDPGDEHYRDLMAMQEQLQSFRTEAGEPYRLVALPLPAPKCDENGERLPATYANFLIINGAVLVPTYGDPADAVALERLKACFPDRELIPIDALPLIRQYGSIHCATMQLPEGVL